jgi:hypothetical protein
MPVSEAGVWSGRFSWHLLSDSFPVSRGLSPQRPTTDLNVGEWKGSAAFFRFRQPVQTLHETDFTLISLRTQAVFLAGSDFTLVRFEIVENAGDVNPYLHQSVPWKFIHSLPSR